MMHSFDPTKNGGTPAASFPSAGNGTKGYFPPFVQNTVTFSKKDFFFAVFSLFFGYLFCRAFPFFKTPAGTSLFLLLLTGGAGAFLLLLRRWRTGPRDRSRKVGKSGATRRAALSRILLFVALLLFSLSPLLQSGVGMRFLAVFLYFFLFFCTLGCVGGFFFEKSDAGEPSSDLLFFNLVRSLLFLPFGRCGKLFPALFRGGQEAKNSPAEGAGVDAGAANAAQTSAEKSPAPKRAALSGKFVLLICGGLSLALLPTLIAFALLSYDSNFTQLMDTLFSRLHPSTIFSHIGSFLLGIPLAMLLYSSAFILSRGQQEMQTAFLPRDTCLCLRQETKFLPQPMSAAVFLPPLLLYLLFFISQHHEYYLSVFTGRLPEGFVFSSYAREGFFNLCAVAALNALLLLFLSLFTKKREDGTPALPERLGGVLLSLTTLLLIAMAMLKLGMYISVYGLSLKRLLAAIATVFLAIAFLAVIITRLIPVRLGKPRLFPFLVCLFLIFSCAFTTVDLKTVVAEYNADAYLRGEISEVDLESIAELGESGIPALVRLAAADVRGSDGQTVAENPYCYAAIQSEARELQEEGSLLSFSIPRARARAALQSQGGLAILQNAELYKDPRIPFNPMNSSNPMN